MNEQFRKVYNDLTIFQKIGYGLVTAYYVSPIGYFLHYPTYNRYWQAIKLILASPPYRVINDSEKKQK